MNAPEQMEAIRVPVGVEYLVRDRRGRVGAAGQDDGVRVGQGIQAPRRTQGERTRVHGRGGSTDPYAVGGATIWQPDAGEHLDRRRQVERDDLVQSKHRNGMHGHTVGTFADGEIPLEPGAPATPPATGCFLTSAP
jgi:hypothetical protein